MRKTSVGSSPCEATWCTALHVWCITLSGQLRASDLSNTSNAVTSPAADTVNVRGLRHDASGFLLNRPDYANRLYTESACKAPGQQMPSPVRKGRAT